MGHIEIPEHPGDFHRRITTPGDEKILFTYFTLLIFMSIFLEAIVLMK